MPPRSLDAPRWRIQQSEAEVLTPKEMQERVTSTQMRTANIRGLSTGRPVGDGPGVRRGPALLAQQDEGHEHGRRG